MALSVPKGHRRAGIRGHDGPGNPARAAGPVPGNMHMCSTGAQPKPGARYGSRISLRRGNQRI